MKICCLFLLFLAAPAAAQDRDVLPLQRLNGPIVLDGLSFEKTWRSVAPYIPTQYEPDNGDAATERTEFLVAYDTDYLYFALRAYDSDPTGIRYNTLYRDRLSGDDHFEILVDTYNDNETGVLFTTTPAGIRREAAVSNDASGGGIASGGWLNVDYNTYWDVATAITDSGWFAEMRIPFSSLRFQPDSDGSVTMGISLQRKIARKTERLVFPSVEPVANWAFLKPSLAQKIVLQDVQPVHPVYVTPYVLTGAGRSTALNDARTAYRHRDEFTREIGGDLKYSLSNNATLDLTVNTDFAQVEADDQQINLTRFSLFFPEKRQFFQERAGIFDFRTGGYSRLFHSRRIGLTETGQPVRILGGARVAGRFGLWDVGILSMQTAESAALPSENFGVFRARRRVLNPYSYAGGMVTSRLGVDGSYNIAYGLDSVIRLFGDDYLTLQWAHSFDDARIDAPGYDPLNGGRLTVEMERRRREAWEYHSVLAWAGADYDPGIGFSERNDFTLLDHTVSYTWLPPDPSSFIWHTFGVRGFAFLRNGDGSLESAEVGPEWEYAARDGTGAALEAKVIHEDLLQQFLLSQAVVVPSGSYTFFRIGASYHETHTRLFQLRPSVNAGTFYDGWQATAEITPIVYVSPHLEMAGGYQYSRVRFPDRATADGGAGFGLGDSVRINSGESVGINSGESVGINTGESVGINTGGSASASSSRLDAHLFRVRIGTALNTRLSTNVFIQYNSVADAFSANVRFRYNFREGNDLWIVYNEGVNTDRYRSELVLPRTDNRTILVKYTHTFAL